MRCIGPRGGTAMLPGTHAMARPQVSACDSAPPVVERMDPMGPRPLPASEPGRRCTSGTRETALRTMTLYDKSRAPGPEVPYQPDFRETPVRHPLLSPTV